MKNLIILIFMMTCITTQASSSIKTQKNSASIFSETTNSTPEENKIYLISSSSEYDEKVIPEIKKAFAGQGYVIDTTYLDQKPTVLGYVNTDKNRAINLINALSDNNVKYLWFIRGGSGAFNLYPQLYKNRERISKSTPKIIIGFSDVTAIHDFINNKIHWPSIHGVLASHNKEINQIDKKNKINMYSSINNVFQAIHQGVQYYGIEPINSLAFNSVSGILRAYLNRTLYQTIRPQEKCSIAS